jgi:two-component system, LytTR family, response regulator LytT
MKILIIEDEQHAIKKMQRMVLEIKPSCIIDTCDSIQSSVNYLREARPELIFMDIRLGDGLSFEIFEKVKISCPIIFTTAYDEYALKAFKVNSIDYLLKPIDKAELQNAFDKYENNRKTDADINIQALYSLLQPRKEYKQRYLIKIGLANQLLEVSDIAYFYTEDGCTIAVDNNRKKHIIDHTLDQIQNEIDPQYFFRINRGVLIRDIAITRFEPYLNSRLSIQSVPPHHETLIVAREKAKEFKQWIEK